MLAAIQDSRIQRIITHPDDSGAEWKRDLARFESGDVTLTRFSAGESTIKAVQRLLIFLGYSTSSTGAFAIDGDFGRGTNRAVAQFQFDHGLNNAIKRSMLCYDCNWQNASRNIVAIPDTKLTVKTLEKMLEVALQMINTNQVMCGHFEEALFHLNSLHMNKFYSCRQILHRYGALVDKAVKTVRDQQGVVVQPEWVLAIMKQETAGVVRPRFEQHYLTRLNNLSPNANLVELRFQSMSFGLGQIMGANYKRVGAASARSMFTSGIDQQALFVARFLTSKRSEVGKKNPSDQDFHSIARFYNGPAYASHHYNEKIATWFKEFQTMM